MVDPNNLVVGYNNVGSSSATKTDDPGDIAASRHLEGANYAFVDGHVKWYKGRGADSKVAHTDSFDYDANGIKGTGTTIN